MVVGVVVVTGVAVSSVLVKTGGVGSATLVKVVLPILVLWDDRPLLFDRCSVIKAEVKGAVSFSKAALKLLLVFLVVLLMVEFGLLVFVVVVLLRGLVETGNGVAAALTSF